jgi:hypothetical protein
VLELRAAAPVAADAVLHATADVAFNATGRTAVAAEHDAAPGPEHDSFAVGSAFDAADQHATADAAEHASGDHAAGVRHADTSDTGTGTARAVDPTDATCAASAGA